jgi:hypothetical protein
MGNLDSGNMCEIQVFEWFYSICLERDLISREEMNEHVWLYKKMRAISFLPSAYLMGFADLSCRNQQLFSTSGYMQ